MFLNIFQNEVVDGLCILDEGHNFISLQAAPDLLLYSYIPAIVIALIISFIVYRHNRSNQTSKAFLFFSISYALWVINNTLQWVLVPNNLIYLSWHLTSILEVGFYLSALYFFISFISQKEISKYTKKLIYFLLFLIIIISPSILNIDSYDYENCEGHFGFLWNIIYGFESLTSLLILGLGIYYSNLKENLVRRKEILFFSISLSFFLSLFTASNIGGELLQEYSFELYGPIGMVIFIGIVSYLIIKYQTFNVKVVSTQILIYGLGILIGSQFFFIKTPVNFVLNGITFVGIIIFGVLLIKSVKREIEQRDRLENLRLSLEKSNLDLEIANDKLKSLDKLKTEFLSLASHQLRSPLTAIKGYSSMVLEGDYGELSPEAKEVVDRIFQSSKSLAIIVEDLLSVAKIEQGGMKYEMNPFSLTEIADAVVKDFTINAEKKNLRLTSSLIEKDQTIVNGDREKIKQVIINLVDNAIKYTKVGEINVSVSKTPHDTILLSVRDTGMGMTKEIKDSLFEKFSRGDGARMNTSGSGLGLYLAKQIIMAHKGHIYVDSDGPEKGSTFSIELYPIKEKEITN